MLINQAYEPIPRTQFSFICCAESCIMSVCLNCVSAPTPKTQHLRGDPEYWVHVVRLLLLSGSRQSVEYDAEW